jgi:hypothetical protein
MTQDEYYDILFDHSVPGLPEKANELGLTSLQYMRKYGVFEVAKDVYRLDERKLSEAELIGALPDENGVLRKPVTMETAPPLVGEAGAVGVELADGSKVQGCRRRASWSCTPRRSPSGAGRSTRPRDTSSPTSPHGRSTAATTSSCSCRTSVSPR